MRSRLPVGYVVRIEGSDVTLNLLDMHRGQLASHAQGVSTVTEVGSLLVLDSGSRALVMKVVSLSFDEPREAHRQGVGSSTHQSEPLRNISGIVVGRLTREAGKARFISDSIATPPLGAEAFPLTTEELTAILGSDIQGGVPIKLGDDLRGGGSLHVDLESLISRHVAVLGSSGQGKSCFTAAVLQQIVRLPSARVLGGLGTSPKGNPHALDVVPIVLRYAGLGGWLDNQMSACIHPYTFECAAKTCALKSIQMKLHGGCARG